MVDKEELEEELGEKVYPLRELSDEFKERGQKVTVIMLRNYIKRGHLKAIRLGGQYYVKESDVEWGMDMLPRRFSSERENLQDRNENQGTKQAIDLEIRSSSFLKKSVIGYSGPEMDLLGLVL